MYEHIAKRLLSQEQLGLRRRLKVAPDSLIDFSSNDYLGLSRSKELWQLINDEIETNSLHHNGSTGSRLLTGNSGYTSQVESELASFFGGDAALILNSGYSANLAVLSSLPQRGDTILYDDRSHASLKDGARLSLAARFSFRHNDLNDLENKIRNASKGNIFVVAESVYSMDGDQAPLTDLVSLCEKYDACLIIDEAHSTGVDGPAGKGLAVKYNLQDRVPVRIYTFGKGMGVHGACIVGTKALCDYIVNFARPFIYTTAMTPHSIAAIRCAFKFVDAHPELQSELKNIIAEFKMRTPFLPEETKHDSPIQTFIVPGNENVRAASQKMMNHGIDVRPILSPTVPKGSERLRICLHAYNSAADVKLLADQLTDL